MPSLLILFLFYLSFHTCDGRLLNIGHKADSRHLQSRFPRPSGKGVEMRDTNTTLPESARLTAKQPPSEEKAALVGGAALEETNEGDTVGMAEELEATEEGEDGAREAPSGGVRTGSRVTVSWRVPRDTYKGHPGFNIDYDAPRTHPPSHN